LCYEKSASPALNYSTEYWQRCGNTLALVSCTKISKVISTDTYATKNLLQMLAYVYGTPYNNSRAYLTR